MNQKDTETVGPVESTRPCLSVLSWNARGLSAVKGEQLRSFISNTVEPIDVICIQETKLSDKRKPIKIDNFQQPLQFITTKVAVFVYI